MNADRAGLFSREAATDSSPGREPGLRYVFAVVCSPEGTKEVRGIAAFFRPFGADPEWSGITPGSRRGLLSSAPSGLVTIAKQAFVVALLIGLLASPAYSAPATRPAAASTRPTSPASRPAVTKQAAEQNRKRVADLTSRAIKLLEEQKRDQAELLLVEALKLDPASTVNLYNLACVQALKNRPDLAIGLLEKAAECGYADFTHLTTDPDLKSLHDLPGYKALLAMKPLYQKRAAERSLADLKQQFGDSYIYELDVENKLIFATNVDQETLASLKHALLAQARSQWAQLFEHRPDAFIRIVVPSPNDYKKLIRMPGVGGVYNDPNKVLIARQLGQVITHEFTHALHSADRAPLNQDHPIWIVEGIASMWEAAVWTGPKKDVLTPQDNFRIIYLQNAVQGHKLIPLEKLIAMDQPEFVEKANLAYGQSSSVMLYLFEKGLLRKFYEQYKKDYEKDPSGKVTLEAVAGQSLPEFEKSWIAWMRKRTPPPATTGPGGAFLGAQMGNGPDAVDGIRIGSILPNGPADKAGIKTGDVLVKIDGNEIRDFQSYGPLMSRYRPGEVIVLRLRRGKEYYDAAVVLARRADLVNEPKPELLVPAKSPTTRPGA